MTTIPPLPAGEAHHARQIAESFGDEAERYERTRPTYPKAMVDAVLAASPGRDFLDVGTGTGISARPFRQEGCRVLGVEPDERMAESPAAAVSRSRSRSRGSRIGAPPDGPSTS